MKRKPSRLTKLTKRSKDIVNAVLVGDVYDFSNGQNTIEQKFKYCTSVESGYIYDKQGNRYDVLCTSEQTDSGAIVGAGMNYQAQINYGGTILSVNSYSGIMSRSTGDKIISTLREGIFLEDYLKQYLYDVSHEHRDLANHIINSHSQPTATKSAPESGEKTSVIDAIRADREKPRQPGEKTEKAKNRDDGDR